MKNIFEIENTVVTFDTLQINVKQHDDYEWIMSTQQVADGYGVADNSIRMHKSRQSDELIEGKHFIHVTNSDGGSQTTFWTKKGVIRLGFFIKSENAKKFRDWAEDLILQKINQQFQIPQTYAEALLEAGRLAGVVEEQQKLIDYQKPRVEYANKYLLVA